MATTVLEGQVTRSEQVGSKKGQISFDSELLWQFHCSHLQSREAEPPRKRVKVEHVQDENDVDVVSYPSIPIGQVNLILGDAAYATSITEPDDYCGSVDIVLLGVVDRGKGHAALKIGSAHAKTSKVELEVHFTHSHDTDELKDLEQIAKLQRRSNSTSRNAIAYAQVRLLRSPVSVDGTDRSLALACTILWPDGAAAPMEKSNDNNIDKEILVRYFGVPRLFSTTRPGYRRQISEKAVTPQDFYDAVHIPDPSMTVPDSVHNSELRTDLYPFQKRAVAWMLQRERAPDAQGHTSDMMDVSFRSAQDLDGRECLVSDLETVVISPQLLQQRTDVRGGILSEEMGLGKTCELLALICTHQRSPSPTTIKTSLRNTRATLIVTPNTILQQWKDEITRHAPHLIWTHYEGMSALSKSKKTEEDVMDTFEGADIVLVTYHILAGEIHFAVDPPDRALRHKSKQLKRKRSPLVQMDWWRVCLDEAQMVESGVSKAAQTASLIPRHNAWAISGTPVKKDVQDLRGLLVFLGLQPFANSDATWKCLVTFHETFEAEFKKLFGRIALRHTKDKIRNELRLPPQRRVVVTMPFTTVEEQNYQNLFEQMADECGLSTDGSPLSGLWDPDSLEVIEKMREWLVRLRQTCLHPQVGARNKRALGRSGGPLRTVEEVLGVMIDQNESAIASEARMSVTTFCLQGHIILNAKDVPDRAEKALVYYQKALGQAEALVEEAREELSKIPVPDAADAKSGDESEDDSPEQKKRGRLRNTLRNVLELQHMCEFYLGTAYFQMKSNDDVEENSDRWKELEENEVEHYDNAKVIRREVLRDAAKRAEKTMKDVDTNHQKSIDTALPSMTDFESHGGIEYQRALEKADRLSDLLERQTEYLVAWRSKVSELLLKSLVDVEDKEVTGEEYEDSTKQQEEMYAYFDAYRAIVADRATCITGQINTLVNHEMTTLYKESQRQDEFDLEEGREPPESRRLLRDLLDQRNAIKQKDNDLISLRGLAHEARSSESSLEWLGKESARARGELALVRKLMVYLQTMTDGYNKLQPQLEKDQDLFKVGMNHRLDFYRQLQQLSDTVAPWRDELDEHLDTAEWDAATYKVKQHESSLGTLRSKRRFLLHLREQSSNDAERICVICQQNFEQGVLTICGHQFCKECIGLWWREHRSCPVCKRHLKTTDFHNITYKPQELKAHEELPSTSSPHDFETGSSSSSTTPDPATTAPKIYASMSTSDLTAIKSIDLPSHRSFGTKIDTISRHLLYIRQTSPGTKTVIFSQYRDFLSVLSSAFATFRISHVSISAKDSISRFREDASIEAFLLDAKTDSSGLNLVNATNVMLCEPLVNPGIELQAIARVHRIGQNRETKVFMYLVSGTVEEGVYEVSVKRRLEVMHRSRGGGGSKEASRGATPALGGEVDKAERLEMQSQGMEKLLGKGKGGGENVRSDDLWKCLFGVARRRAHRDALGFLKGGGGEVHAFVAGEEGGAGREEVARFVRGAAAEGRRGAV
ncbi:ATP-dependent helicase-like protein [Elsinoe australis]|uniref:ATP-dependent helicase-like protein n=1 Tax=Elsinoe australis TaxID=40998 RepID=A0A4U7B297_9PEZI|nr:ATP-dependent helicase-like protein [Elsinoe australis]